MCPVLARPADHVARVAVPAGVAGGGAVVQAAQLGTLRQHPQRLGGHVGQQLGAGGRADLVVDHGERLALGGQAQHGAGEVAAARRIDPAGAQDQVAAAAGADRLLAGELACGRRR